MFLEGDFSSCDIIDEKEVTYGSAIDIDDDPITHSLFSKSPILDFEIYVLDSKIYVLDPDPSLFIHHSLSIPSCRFFFYFLCIIVFPFIHGNKSMGATTIFIFILSRVSWHSPIHLNIVPFFNNLSIGGVTCAYPLINFR